MHDRCVEQAGGATRAASQPALDVFAVSTLVKTLHGFWNHQRVIADLLLFRPALLIVHKARVLLAELQHLKHALFAELGALQALEVAAANAVLEAGIVCVDVIRGGFFGRLAARRRAS